MELKPNMYVRTKDGDVFILDKIEDNHLIPRYVYIPYIIIEADVKKTSHNLIDLIEVGDYVNRSKVSIVESEYIYWETGNAIHYKYIETIVTKEQFSQMEYKIGGNE